MDSDRHRLVFYQTWGNSIFIFKKRAKFPRFKKKSGKQSCQYPQGVKIRDNHIFLPKVGKGSKRYAKAKLQVAKSHQQVKNARNDFQHKLSFKLANENQAVSIEDLNISGMSKNRRLARHILDLGWHNFTTKLHYKLADRGHHLVKNDRFYASSKTCSDCGHKIDKLPLNIRRWTCPECDAEHDRDENAAINLDNEGMIKLKAEGYTVSARGGFNISRVSMNPQTPTKREAPLIALA